MGLREPDKPVIVVDAANVDSLKNLTSEQLAGLRELLGGEEERRRLQQEQQDDKDYQTDQASYLSNAGWHEIKRDWLDRARVDAEEQDWNIEGLCRTYVHDDEENEYPLSALPSTPTLYDFYTDLYGITPRVWNYEGLEVLVNHRDRKYPYQTYDDYSQFADAIKTETSFIYMGLFWKPKDGWLTSVANAMISIGGFCVDIDRVDDEEGRHYHANFIIEKLLEDFEKHPEIKPNYIHLSGTGVQLWYVFGRQIPLLSKKSPRRDKYNRLLKKLYAHFEENLGKGAFKVDTSCAHINCALRAPSSPAKSHYPTRLFMVPSGRRTTDVMDLNEYLGGELRWYDTERLTAEQWKAIKEEKEKVRAFLMSSAATEKQLAYIDKLHAMKCLSDEDYARAGEATKEQADELIKRGEGAFTEHREWSENGGWIKTDGGHVVKRHPRSPKLYHYTLERIRSGDTPTGTRYNACFGLAGLAWNCCIPKSQLRRDLESLLETEWAKKLSKDSKPFNHSDINAAMRGYNELGSLRPRAMLERKLGWEYSSPQKRNGRSRQQHLWGEWVKKDGTPVINTARENRRLASDKSRDCAAKAKRQKVVDSLSAYLLEHPEASKRECCRELSMSATTVTKYWAQVCALVEVDDTRTGNHSPSADARQLPSSRREPGVLQHEDRKERLRDEKARISSRGRNEEDEFAEKYVETEVQEEAPWD